MSQPTTSRPKTVCGTRREFLAAVAGVAAIAALPLAARADDLPALSESDPTGSALGYKEDASKVDAAKFPTHKPTQTCAGCSFYQGTGPRGACTLFPGKSVAGKGWCSAFAAKT
ncbi:MAG TPA: high-potential iron-sulfur protein [Tahibacter sp.]|nr:high-potential iron-sulfur protein [Tahibacter sp.]